MFVFELLLIRFWKCYCFCGDWFGLCFVFLFWSFAFGLLIGWGWLGFSWLLVFALLGYIVGGKHDLNFVCESRLTWVYVLAVRLHCLGFGDFGFIGCCAAM